MTHECIVPNWNLRHQRQEQLIEGEEGNRSSHVLSQIHHHHHHTTPHPAVPMPNYEVAELTWENGQLAMHGLGGLIPTGPTKPTWSRASDTLESIVHQATWPNPNSNILHQQHDHCPANMISTAGSTTGKRADTSGNAHTGPALTKKRVRSEAEQCGRNNFGSSIREERSACASASATTFCKESDTTMMTWASFESPPSPRLKTKNVDEDSACQDGSENLDDQEDQETKGETGRSHSTRRSRAAAVHNQSERRRRDRINQKMKALQKLVPNSSKTDKASMLDEVIEYLKQLQAQVHLMSSARNMPQMMMPAALGMHHHQQQQMQMALLARMGAMGVGVGINGMGMGMHSPVPTTAAPTFIPPHPFVVPHMIPNHAQRQASTDHAAINNSIPFNNPYCAFLGQQPMNMDLYNKMAAAIYQQQVNQTTQPTSSP